VTIGCEYGTLPPLLGKFRILRKDLAKDTGPIGSGTGGTGTSPRGRINGNFARAVTAAIEDTADKWSWFRQQVTAKYGKTRGAKILCALQGDTFDARLCSQEVALGNACTEREAIARADEDTDVAPAMIAQPTKAEQATAEKLYESLAAFCVIEETDLTRSEVTRGGVAETGKDAAKAAGLSALATWNACPAQLASVLPAMTQRHKDAYQALMEQKGDNGKKEMTILGHLYADCILATHQRRTGN
jgi:hypothetical protein